MPSSFKCLNADVFWLFSHIQMFLVLKAHEIYASLPLGGNPATPRPRSSFNSFPLKVNFWQS